jgi:hypothetical protein
MCVCVYTYVCNGLCVLYIFAQEPVLLGKVLVATYFCVHMHMSIVCSSGRSMSHVSSCVCMYVYTDASGHVHSHAFVYAYAYAYFIHICVMYGSIYKYTPPTSDICLYLCARMYAPYVYALMRLNHVADKNHGVTCI